LSVTIVSDSISGRSLSRTVLVVQRRSGVQHTPAEPVGEQPWVFDHALVEADAVGGPKLTSARERLQQCRLAEDGV
jgi:hypothetical protein